GPSQAAPFCASSEPSALAASQSSSTPLQTSRVEPVLSEQTSSPPTHDFVPSWQRSLSGPSQAAPFCASSEPSALAASQSSSTPLQTSRVEPVLSEQTRTPATHDFVPSWQRSLSGP